MTIHPHAETIAVLDAVRDVLSNPERWTKEFFALDEHGDDVPPLDPSAQCWCLAGAVVKVCGGRVKRYPKAMAALVRTVGETDGFVAWARVTRFNDRSTHADVLALLDETIRRLRNG